MEEGQGEFWRSVVGGGCYSVVLDDLRVFGSNRGVRNVFCFLSPYPSPAASGTFPRLRFLRNLSPGDH